MVKNTKKSQLSPEDVVNSVLGISSEVQTAPAPKAEAPKLASVVDGHFAYSIVGYTVYVLAFNESGDARVVETHVMDSSNDAMEKFKILASGLF